MALGAVNHTCISQRIQAYCQASGLRPNAKRNLVADTLQEMDGAATAEAIWHHLVMSGKKISSTSIYLYLNWLTKRGFAERYIIGVREVMYVMKK